MFVYVPRIINAIVLHFDSFMQFADFDLDAALLKAIDAMGFSKATSIQQLAIPEALDGRDVLAGAPTGTGKTAAFLRILIGIIQRFTNQNQENRMEELSIH